MEPSSPNPPKKRRHSKACTRCRKRKIRCDLKYPACGACAAAGATCLGFDSVHGNEAPRSTVSHLEEEVARLELELLHVKSQSRSISDISNYAVERLCTGLARATVDPGSRHRKVESLLPLTSTYFISGSSVPWLNSQAWDTTKARRTPESPPGAINIGSIPRHVIETMLRHYCEIYRPLYPAINESEVYEACDRVYNNTQPSDFDNFCVYITLAISTTTLIYQDEDRATTATQGFWSTAMVHLEKVGLTSSYERLQALQLLTHYGFLNPKDVDCCKCAAAAMRQCLQLGLHHELPESSQIKLETVHLNNRRRLFWNSYSIDSAAHSVRCQPFVWPKSGFTVKLPDFDSHSSPTAHIWSLREIESEITRFLYYPSLSKESLDAISDTSFEQWYTCMQERLNSWYQTTRQSVNLSEKIEFHELHFHVQVLRLNRPSLRCPIPTRDMRKKALNSSIAVIKEYSIIDRLGKLFYLWHAAHCIVEAGICLLASVVTGMELDQDTTHLEHGEIQVLTRYLKTIPALLSRISRRWPNIALHASAVEAICLSLSEKLQHWPDGDVIENFDSYALQQRIKQLSLFSPFPSDGQPAMDNQRGTTGNELILASASSATEPTLFNSSWAVPQPATDPSSSMFLDPYGNGIDGGDAFAWDFAGMDSEEIFVALLEGSQPLLLNDFVGST